MQTLPANYYLNHQHHHHSRVGVHLAGQGLHQLRYELVGQRLALLSDDLEGDEVARPVEHLLQLLLGLVGEEHVSGLPDHVLADLTDLVIVSLDCLLLPDSLDTVTRRTALTCLIIYKNDIFMKFYILKSDLLNVGTPVGRAPTALRGPQCETW